MKIALGIVGTLLVFIGFFAWLAARGLESAAGLQAFLSGLFLLAIAVVIDRLDTLIRLNNKV